MNFVLGILVAIGAAYGATMGWIIAGGVIVALISLWAALELNAETSHSTAHAR